MKIGGFEAPIGRISFMFSNKKHHSFRPSLGVMTKINLVIRVDA